MAASDLSIEMLPARHGDALWIEWGPLSDRHRMLIDAGPTAAYDDVCQRIERVDVRARCFDLMVVTHIDLDHIGGAIKLLEDRTLGLRFDDIWFNDYRHLSDEPPNRGALQGEYLAKVLEEGRFPWNVAFGNRAVRVEPTGPLPRVPLRGGVTLVLLSPLPEKLTALRGEWEKTLAEAERKADERAAEEQAEATASRGGPPAFGKDSSKANGSSIAMVLEYGNERWLLAGDAHSDVLLAGLERYGNEIGEHPVRLDGFKLSHHGSARNITTDLLAAIDCPRFLVSTDGSYFKHPDEACLDLIVRTVDCPELVFNYRSTFTEPWDKLSTTHRATFPELPTDTISRDDDSERDVSAAHSAPSMPSWAHDAAPTAPADSEPEASADASSPESDRTDPDPAVGMATKTPPPVVVKVTVNHGSLERAAHPVLVGHYVATPLSGAEGFVDRRYGGRLADRLATDGYPGHIGESLLIEAPHRKPPYGGVLVVGLGEYGELTPTRLVETVRAALVHHALDQAARHAGPDELSLAISSVLLGGTGDQGLTITASVRAILDGVTEANRALRACAKHPSVQFSELELWERNAPEAELTFRSFDERQATAGGPDGTVAAAAFEPPIGLRIADGALTESLPVDSGAGRWWRVRVADCSTRHSSSRRADPSSHLELEFTVGGRLARTGTVIHRVERRRLERILRDAVSEKQPTKGLSTTLFELLFPNQLKWDLMAAQDIQLEVDEVTADIPWEMLEARNPERGERGQLALRAALVRQLKLTDVPAIRRSPRPTALVIGNPPVGGAAASLDGAYAEAMAVIGALDAGGYEVTARCYDTTKESSAATTLEIETALFADDYRIIHIAAHGFYQPDDPTRTGVVIGPDDFLTADVFRQVNVIPDVVFLNCCHVGAVNPGLERGAIDFTHRNLHRLGASLARQLIACGVRAVVVAGWAVDDAAAKAFASEFYAAMLGGKAFGWAVHRARWAAWSTAEESNTWGAYQCYGDGGYVLPDHGTRSEEAGDVTEPRTVREALRWLDALVSRIESVGIQMSGGADFSRTEHELVTIETAAIRCRWLANGHLCEELADAWKAFGEFDRAIAWYELALSAGDGQLTLAGIEQLANLRDREASALARHQDATDGDRRRAARLTEQSMEAITLLERLSLSGERAALRAGHHKRRATTATGDDRLEAISQAADAYLHAYRQGGEAYALLNHIQLEEIRSRIAGEPADVDEVAEDFTQVLARRDDSTYWKSVARPDSQLTDAIRRDAISASHTDLVESYNCAFDSRSTFAQRASTLDHLLDLAELHPDDEQRAALRELHDALAPPK